MLKGLICLTDHFQALVLEDQKQPLTVKQLRMEDLPEGDITIEVAYSSINYKDAMVGVQHQMVKNYPHVPGIDLAGTVIASKTPDFKTGDEVIVTSYFLGTGDFGGFSEIASVPKEWVVPLPDGLTLKEAMILGTAGFTAALSLQRLEDNGLTPEKGPVLVTGATGGVGSIAVNMLAKKGYDVVASTGKSSEIDYLTKIGAKEVLAREEVQSTDNKPVRKKQWAAAIDPVGGSTTSFIISSLQYGGSVATSGLTGGTEVNTNVLPFLGRAVNWLGIDSVMCPMDVRRAIWNRLANDLKPTLLQGELVQEVKLEEVPAVLKRILQGKLRGRTIVNFDLR